MSVTIATIDEDSTLKLIDAAIQWGRDKGKAITVAVCDEGSNLKGFLRMDGASLFGSKNAQDKAYTSSASRRPTHGFYERFKDEPALALGMVHAPRLIIYGGGYPVVIDGHVVGGIGVSGGGHWTMDMECALFALRAIGAKADWE